MNIRNGISGYYNFTHSQIQTYLTSKGVYTGDEQTTGKLSFNNCETVLNQNRFIMMISSGQDFDYNTYSYNTVYHATALVGTKSDNRIVIADPHGTSDTDTIYYYGSFYSSGITYTWNAGYYTHLTY